MPQTVTPTRPATNVELMAISKAIKEEVVKAGSRSLAPGKYPVNIVVQVQGTIKKGDPITMKCPMMVPWMTLFGLAMSRLNRTTGESIEDIARSFLVEAGEGVARNPEAIQKADEETKAHVEAIMERLVEATTKIAEGRVTTNLNIIMLSPEEPTPFILKNEEHVTEVIKAAPGAVKIGDNEPIPAELA